MKYFARINGRQEGPYTLSELIANGVRPSTYVWRKGMPDWAKAEDVSEICRAMRRALAGFDPETGNLLSPAQHENAAAQEAELSPEDAMRMEEEARASGLRGVRNLPEPPTDINFDVKPRGVSIVMAILATLFCFPFTGLVAIWFAMKCRAHWKMSEQPNMPASEAAAFKRKAHDDARIYRMMIGITFCLGIIMVGFTMSRTLL